MSKLFIGKFRILTKKHYSIIETNNIENICIISSSKTSSTALIRERMIKKCFPDINIKHYNTANLLKIFEIFKNINILYCGEDRVKNYSPQIENYNINVDLKVISRDDNMSATNIINKIDDIIYFYKNTPRQIHNMYFELKGIYGKHI